MSFVLYEALVVEILNELYESTRTNLSLLSRLRETFSSSSWSSVISLIQINILALINLSTLFISPHSSFFPPFPLASLFSISFLASFYSSGIIVQDETGALHPLISLALVQVLFVSLVRILFSSNNFTSLRYSEDIATPGHYF